MKIWKKYSLFIVARKWGDGLDDILVFCNTDSVEEIVCQHYECGFEFIKLAPQHVATWVDCFVLSNPLP